MKSLTVLKADKTTKVSELKKLKQLKQVELGPKIALLEAEVTAIEQEIKDVEELEKKEKNAVKEAKEAAKEAAKEEKLEETEQEKAAREWMAFKMAIKVYEDTGMCFHRASPPRYFHKNVYIDKDIKTKKERRKTEIEFFSLESMKDNWLELQSETARKFLRRIVDGGDVAIFNPETEVMETYNFPRRVYSKLGNTRHIPDEKTYNMIDFRDVMEPTNLQNPKEVVECPPILKSLMYSMAGAKFDWNTEGEIVCDKQDAVDWLEKWIYGVVYADRGNNMLSLPVFFGKGKRGRNALCDLIIPEILGQELSFSGTWSTVDSGFNAFKLGKIFVYIDEIPAREEWNKFKSLTGSPYDYVKQKYGPEFLVENTTAFCIGANEPSFPLPFEDGEQMMRVSPINCTNSNTFAENAYAILEHESPGSVETLLKSIDVDYENIKNDVFMQGDTVLRNFGDLWRTREVVQQFLNYLHHRFQVSENGLYTLMPLRGKDWDEIASTKSNPVLRTVEHVEEHKADIITILELHEIYKVLVGKKEDKFVKQIGNFSTEIWSIMEKAGWQRKQQCRVKIPKTLGQNVKDMRDGGNVAATYETIQTTLFFRNNTVDISKHIVSVDSYITEVHISGTPIKQLKFKNQVGELFLPGVREKGVVLP